VFDDFKKFVMRGNVVDLAVAVVLGVAFVAVVTALVEDLITPIIAAIFGEPDFSRLRFTINGSIFQYGAFINAVIAFILIAAALFFFVVKPINSLAARAKAKGEPTAPPTRKCPECLSDIPVEAMRCAFCGERVPVTSA
jgi:large conductance mechanosensitive channel